jgi:hypothetical protein
VKPRAFDRNFGPPEWLFFDDREKLHHYCGRGEHWMRERAAEGLLTIHTMIVRGREFEYVVYSEVRSVVRTLTRGNTWRAPTE